MKKRPFKINPHLYRFSPTTAEIIKQIIEQISSLFKLSNKRIATGRMQYRRYNRGLESNSQRGNGFLA